MSRVIAYIPAVVFLIKATLLHMDVPGKPEELHFYYGLNSHDKLIDAAGID